MQGKRAGASGLQQLLLEPPDAWLLPHTQQLPTPSTSKVSRSNAKVGVGVFATLGGASSDPPESQDTVTCLLDSILIRSSC